MRKARLLSILFPLLTGCAETRAASTPPLAPIATFEGPAVQPSLPEHTLAITDATLLETLESKTLTSAPLRAKVVAKELVPEPVIVTWGVPALYVP